MDQSPAHLSSTLLDFWEMQWFPRVLNNVHCGWPRESRPEFLGLKYQFLFSDFRLSGCMLEDRHGWTEAPEARAAA